MSERIFILPLWIRVWHWTNALLMIILAVYFVVRTQYNQLP